MWLFLCPPVGWLMALGYRKEVVMNLVQGGRPVLPDWAGQEWRFFREGTKAVGVILVYFTPFFCALWGLAVDDWSSLSARAVEVAIFFGGIIVLAPVCLPALPIGYASNYPWFTVSGAEAVGLGCLFVLTTYVIPAGFMQVSRAGRFRDAFRVGAVMNVFRHHAVAYTEAWVCSGWMTVAALASGPLAPFGIIWSYQGIVYCFNEVLTQSAETPVRARLAKSHFHAYAELRRARTDAEWDAVLGMPAGAPAVMAVDGATWAVLDARAGEGACELLLKGRTGARYRVRLETWWRPQVAVRIGWAVHFVDVSRRDDVLSMRPVAAAVRFGPICVPLPRRLAPKFRPRALAPGAF